MRCSDDVLHTPTHPLHNRSLGQKAKLVVDKVYPTLLYGFKISFGIALIASILASLTAMVVVTQGGSSSDDDNKRSSSSSSSYSSSSYSSWNMFDTVRSFSYITQPRSYSIYDVDEKEMNFLESCYSYLFGDGDPNDDLDTLLDIAIATVIKDNKGVVTCEQMAPFIRSIPALPSTSDTENNLPSTQVDESYMLPILIKYGGEPIVTPDGDIVYKFDEFRVQQKENRQQMERSEFRRKLSIRERKSPGSLGSYRKPSIFSRFESTTDESFDALLELESTFSEARPGTTNDVVPLSCSSYSDA